MDSRDLPTPEHVELRRRSVAMYPPSQGLSREASLEVLEQLICALETLRAKDRRRT